MRKQNKQKNAEEPQKETQRTAARKLLRYLGRQKVLWRCRWYVRCCLLPEIYICPFSPARLLTR